MRHPIFADTAAWLALINKSDAMHKKAKKIRDSMLIYNTRFVVTDYVIVEIANALSRLPFRESAVQLINSITASKNIEIVEIDKEVYNEA